VLGQVTHIGFTYEKYELENPAGNPKRYVLSRPPCARSGSHSQDLGRRDAREGDRQGAADPPRVAGADGHQLPGMDLCGSRPPCDARRIRSPLPISFSRVASSQVLRMPTRSWRTAASTST